MPESKQNTRHLEVFGEITCLNIYLRWTVKEAF